MKFYTKLATYLTLWCSIFNIAGKESNQPSLKKNDNIQSHYLCTFTDEDYNQLLQEPLLDDFYRSMMSSEDLAEIRQSNPKKPLTLMIFMAAANDLFPFSVRNMQQMQQVSSDEHINIVIQINSPGAFSPTRRYVIKPGRRLPVELAEHEPQKLNSGSPYTLIDFVRWAAEHYPADEYALIFWNHGTGANDPGLPRSINTAELYTLNADSNLLEIDRSIGFLDFVANKIKRGICFDETFGSYMTNQDIDFALYEISTNILQQKISLVGFDACLMSMLEIAHICRKYAHYMVGSQELELGLGWDYKGALTSLQYGKMSAKQLAKNIVQAYANFYKNITPDYTQSALDLQYIEKLEESINAISQLLIQAMQQQKNNSVNALLKESSHKKNCLCFDEPTYKDLGSFLKALKEKAFHIELYTQELTYKTQEKLRNLCEQALQELQSAVIANQAGRRLSEASGVSIYFPGKHLASCYYRNPFSLTNLWSKMLSMYMHPTH